MPIYSDVTLVRAEGPAEGPRERAPAARRRSRGRRARSDA